MGIVAHCEETVVRGSLVDARDHGFVREVPAPHLGAASAVAIEGAGLMKHEAVAVDPVTGDLDLTEDNGPNSGMYRYRPNGGAQRIGDLERGGVLEMFKVAGDDGADLRNPATCDSFPVEWVPLVPANRPGSLHNQGQVEPRQQQLAQQDALMPSLWSGSSVSGVLHGARRRELGERCRESSGGLQAGPMSRHWSSLPTHSPRQYQPVKVPPFNPAAFGSGW